MGIKFRELTEQDIECRVGTINNGGLTLLLFKNARTDMSILDEAIGPEAWQCRYEDHKGTLFCGVGILVGAADRQGFREWVWKWDAGAPSNMEAQKGEASDAFKRACTKWGIGRSLYTAPRIFVYADRCNITTGKNGKSQCYDEFKVEKIRIEQGRITGIRIRNIKNGKVVFSWKEPDNG